MVRALAAATLAAVLLAPSPPASSDRPAGHHPAARAPAVGAPAVGAPTIRAPTIRPPAKRAPATQSPGALLVVGGRVWTGDPGLPRAEAVLVVDRRIAYVGDRAEATRRAPAGAQTLDAAGGLVTPGLWDSHLHLVDGGAHLAGVQLRGAASREQFVRRLAEFAATRPRGEWITGGDWDHTVWGGELPARDWIDAATPDHPVWVRRLDGHMALANSAALRAAGVDDRAASPEGGAIDRDAAGRMTGLLRDNAMALVDHAVPEPSAGQRLAAIEAACSLLLASGVTSAVHMGSLDELRALRAARGAGRLAVRVRVATPLGRWAELAELVQREGRGDADLSWGMLKGFVDGSLGSHTALMLEPFSDSPSGSADAAGRRGLLVTSEEDLEAWTQAADAAGLQVAVHAIGDRANRRMLDIFERVARRNGPRDRRFRIEHAQHLDPIDIPRFALLGVIPSVQPYHAIDDGRWAEGVIGPLRARTSYALRSLRDAGSAPALGSDWFVAPPTPLEGIYAAVTRRTLDGLRPDGWVPEERITVDEALAGYTRDAAYAAFADGDRGVLRAGMLADLVVIDRDLLEAPPVELGAARIAATILGGRIVYRDSAAR